MNVNLHDLSNIVSRSSGYLSIDNHTGDLQAKGSNFLSRLVVWIRFKTSSSYRNSIVDAKRKVMASMLSDQTYGEDFRLKIEGLDRKNGFFFNNKPLSTRKVRRFIMDVTQSVDQAVRPAMSAEELRAGLVAWVCGKGETIASSETFDARLSTMLTEKISKEDGIAASDVDVKGIGDEIHRAALNDQEGMATVSDGTQATAHVNKAMSSVLDRRIANLRSQRQAQLYERLSAAGLSEADKRAVNVEIVSSKITTMDELDSRVNQLVVKQIDDEFAQLLRQAQEKHGLHAEFAQLPEVRKQLTEKLAQQDDHKMLSIDLARDKAEQLLSRWVASKQEALLACKESHHASVNDLLTKLSLEEPTVGKTQVQSFRQTLEQTMDEIYTEDRAVYEALGVDKAKLFSMLSRFDRRGVLLKHLQSVMKETREMSSLFGGDNGQVPNVKTAMQKYIKSLSKPMIESYARVEALRGKIPDAICHKMIEKVAKGYVWEPRFISAANGMHINKLIKKNNEGLYELLDSPQVARKSIGSKEDFVSFSLEDLLLAMLGPKNINNHKQRQLAIDQVIPKEAKVKLLNELDKQLQTVRSRVMNEEDADALFQRGAVRFLRTQKIDFEAMALDK